MMQNEENMDIFKGRAIAFAIGLLLLGDVYFAIQGLMVNKQLDRIYNAINYEIITRDRQARRPGGHTGDRRHHAGVNARQYPRINK
jgi:hypothetical protein